MSQPTADWIARQITEAFPWNEVPHYLIRDRVGKQHRDTSSVTVMPSMVKFSCAAFGRWAFVTGRLRRDRRGKTDMPNG